VETVKNALAALAQNSQNEPGLIRYRFFQSKDDPAVFIHFALWQNEVDWRTHVASEIHEAYARSLPEGAWAIPPAATRLQPLDELA
jgi:quinol monooxygenase YgiN